MSVVTVMLIATFMQQNSLSTLQTFQFQVGGMNESEFNDLRAFSAPLTSNFQYDAWSGNWMVEDWRNEESNYRMRRLSTPPIRHAAPFLSRIKTWGYKITFYQSYQEKQEIFRQNCISADMTPSLVHTWILEKDSELVILPPPPTPTTTPRTTTTTGVTTPTKVQTTFSTTVTSTFTVTSTPFRSTTTINNNDTSTIPLMTTTSSSSLTYFAAPIMKFCMLYVIAFVIIKSNIFV